ncbi:MAG: histidinol-phosphate transaminase [Propionibacteriaceae bacterium]|jgi:histidinol-phosphate aminotransferase|nr:histidinol-phosphate transaminase [Propionibacteriaceae bacterium]
MTLTTDTAELAGLADLPLRDELVGAKPYGAPQLDVAVALNVNENPYAPPSKVRSSFEAAIADVAKHLNRYPDRDAVALRGALADYLGFGLDYERIWAANGSNEAMTHILQAFGGPGRTALTFGPTYSMYPEYARNTHTNFVEVPRTATFDIDVEAAVAAIAEHKASVVFIANPNNPTGTRVPLSTIEAICARSEAIVVVDEAYQEFTHYPDDSALSLLGEYPRLVVARTMSKAFAFAGARVGYLASSKGVVDACRVVRLPYHLSDPTQALALAALKHADLLLAQVSQLAATCQSTQRWLRDLGLDVPPSQANFALFGPFDDAHAVWEALLERGVLVREVGPLGYLRVSAGTPDEMAVFRFALQDVLHPESTPTPLAESTSTSGEIPADDAPSDTVVEDESGASWAGALWTKIKRRDW